MNNIVTTEVHPTGKHYTIEQHVQILVALLKAHHIRKIVASPGTTNITFVASVQCDSYFEIYSSVDERAAAYLACGLARESGEPVVLSCTGATASRNYPAGLTEAYYSNLPVLAVTSTQYQGRVGHLYAQMPDRSVLMKDIAKKSIQVREIHTPEERWDVEVSINDVLLELRRHGGGPAHINLMTSYSKDFTVRELPAVRVIQRHTYGETLPSLEGKQILIYVGTHHRWSSTLTEVVDRFCEQYNAAVLCEHISNYRGKYGVYPALIGNQAGTPCRFFDVDVIIHMGAVQGFSAVPMQGGVWRVHPDGEVRDTFKRLTHVFEMEETAFFAYYNQMAATSAADTSYYEIFHTACEELESKVGELPFSNAWIAKTSIPYLPADCELHLGILNSLRTWNLFQIPHNKQIEVYANTGGFGIDGLVATLLGSSLAAPGRLCFGVIGDLALFYDMNSLGNRHVKSNFRLMVVNNGRGTEFRNYNNRLAAPFGEEADPYIAAAGHFGNMSRTLLKHYAEDLGYEYLCAEDKESYLAVVERFFTPETLDKPVLLEVFTDFEAESAALYTLFHLDVSAAGAAKNLAKELLGDRGVRMVKKILNK